MNKNKRDLILLIILCTFLVNYLIYLFIVSPQINKLQAKKVEFANLQEKLNKSAELNVKKKQLVKDIEKLQSETEGFTVLAPYNIDTPQLIYDFYNYCKKYNVIGDTIEFELEDKSTQDTQNATDNAINTLIENNEVVQTDSKTTVKADNQNKTGAGITKLDITLNAYCSKENLDEFLKNLNTITKRKLNIKSINIVSSERSLTVNNENTSENIEIDKHAKLIKGKMKIQIVFLQYIYYDGQTHQNLNSYDFFDINEGFDSISEMFKSK